MNAFEAGVRKVIPAVLIYLRSSDDRFLMIHRLGGAGGVGKIGDYHAGKWNGLGGKLEPDESPWAAAHRELLEEAGLDLPPESFKILGTLQFPHFKAHKGEDWMVFVMSARINRPAAEILTGPCDEGALHWVAASDLLSLNLWAGDRHFMPCVVSGSPFHGTIWYQGDAVVRHQIERL